MSEHPTQCRSCGGPPRPGRKECETCAGKRLASRPKDTPASKPCGLCRRDLPISAYGRASRAPDGRRSRCKECERLTEARKRPDNPVPLVAAKTCTRCEAHLPANCFGQKRNAPDGLRHWCKLCFSEDRAEREHRGYWGRHQEKVRHRDRLGLPRPNPRGTKEEGRQRQAARDERARAVREARAAWKAWLHFLAPDWWVLEYTREQRERARAYYWADPDHYKAQRRKHYWANVDAERQRVRAWAYANPEKRSAQGCRRWARAAAAADGTITPEGVSALLATVTHCGYCGDTLAPADATLDHVEPLAKGGAHSLTNLQACCGSCNASKGARSLDEWLSTMEPDRKTQALAALAEHFTF